MNIENLYDELKSYIPRLSKYSESGELCGNMCRYIINNIEDITDVNSKWNVSVAQRIMNVVFTCGELKAFVNSLFGREYNSNDKKEIKKIVTDVMVTSALIVETLVV